MATPFKWISYFVCIFLFVLYISQDLIAQEKKYQVRINKTDIQKSTNNNDKNQKVVVIGDMLFLSNDLQDKPDLATRLQVNLWTDRIVYYIFENVDQEMRNLFYSAFPEWEIYASVKFVERSIEPKYIRIIQDSANYSFVGMTGGPRDSASFQGIKELYGMNWDMPSVRFTNTKEVTGMIMLIFSSGM